MTRRERVLRELLPVLLILAIQAVIYREYWIGSKIFTGKDLLTAFSLLLNFQSDCLGGGSVPLWNPFLNFGYPFVEHYSNSMFFPTHLLMGLITGSSLVIIQREILFWIFIGGTGVYLIVREQGLSRTTGIIAATGYMYCGQMMALPQWHVLVYNATCFPWLILGYFRATRAQQPLSLISIAFLTVITFGGHITTTVLGIYILTAFIVVDGIINGRKWFTVKYLAFTLTIAFLIAAPKLLPMLESIKLNVRMNDPVISKDSMNIINSYSFLSYLIPVKYYFSIQIGQMAVVAGCYALVRRSIRLNALLIMFLMTAWFLMVDSEGNVSWLRQAVNVFPMMRLVRNEWLEWFYPSLFLILYLAKHVDEFICERRPKAAFGAVLLCIAVTTVAFLAAYDTGLHWKAFLTHCALAAAALLLIYVPAVHHLRLAFAALLLCSEFLSVFNRVNVDEPPQKWNDAKSITITHQIAASRSYRDNQLVAQKFFVSALDDTMRPSIADSRLHPQLYSGLDGNFMDSMNYKHFAGWWYNAQERYDFIQLKESPQLAEMEGLPLYLLSDTPGRASAGSVSFDAITCSSFDFTTSSPTAAIFLLHQFYDARWNAYVDGVKKPIRKTNEYFMGIDLEAGNHRIRYEFSDWYFNLGIIVSGVTLFALVLLLSRGKWMSLVYPVSRQ